MKRVIMSNTMVIEKKKITYCEIIPPKVQRHIDNYIKYHDKCSDAILSLGKTCYDAKKELNTDEFNQFIREVNLDKSVSTVSKFIKIGSSTTRLYRVKDRLPSTWTVVYDLSCLNDDEFIKVLPIISSTMTAKEIRDALNKTKSSSTPAIPEISINLSQKSTDKKRVILKEIEEIARELNFKVNLSKNFEVELNTLTTKANNE